MSVEFRYLEVDGIFYGPKYIVGHNKIGLSVRPSVRASVRPFVRPSVQKKFFF